MGIRSKIRNFLYAVTHAQQLVHAQQELAASGATISMQEGELKTLREYLSFTEQHQDRLRSALQILAPKDLSLDTLREVYNSVIPGPLSYEQAGQYLLGHQWSARKYLQDSPVWEKIEKEVYRIALNQTDIIPYTYDFTAQNRLREQSTEAIGERLGAARLPENMPVGRIDYLWTNGTIRESMEYRNAGELVSDALYSNFYGEPMRITVYSDPKTGTHMDASWRLELDPPPQGFQIAAYQESIAPEPGPRPEPELEM